MYCYVCGKQIEETSSYCPHCGNAVAGNNKAPINSVSNYNSDSVYYQLLTAERRKYDLKIYQDRLTIDGQYWYLKDKEFVSQNGSDTALLQNFIGMGYLSKRSYRKTLAFVFGGVILGALNSIMEKLSELADKANSVLRWIGETVTLPEWMTYLLNGTMVVCIILGLLLFFSKKKVVEISFTDKRICIPQSSLSNVEYSELYQTIRKLSQRQ